MNGTDKITTPCKNNYHYTMAINYGMMCVTLYWYLSIIASYYNDFIKRPVLADDPVNNKNTVKISEC